MMLEGITALVFGGFLRSWSLNLRTKQEDLYLNTNKSSAVAGLAISVVAEAVAAFCILAGVLGILGGLASAYMIGTA
jgi:hypothetical protein